MSGPTIGPTTLGVEPLMLGLRSDPSDPTGLFGQLRTWLGGEAG